MAAGRGSASSLLSCMKPLMINAPKAPHAILIVFDLMPIVPASLIAGLAPTATKALRNSECHRFPHNSIIEVDRIGFKEGFGQASTLNGSGRI